MLKTGDFNDLDWQHDEPVSWAAGNTRGRSQDQDQLPGVEEVHSAAGTGTDNQSINQYILVPIDFLVLNFRNNIFKIFNRW